MRRGGVWLAGVLVFSCACAAAEGSAPVILISIDTLRADHLSAYGYRRMATPQIDSYAAGGTVFGSIDCQVPLTLPSHTSLFTSTYPFENGIEENAERVAAGAVTLAGVLKAHGYQTAAFIGSVFLERELGLDQGFDFYDSPFHFEAFSPLSGSMFFGGVGRSPGAGRDRRDGALVVRAARQWLGAHRGQAVFAFLHLFDLHKPYVAHGGGAATYDGSLGYVDGLLGGLKETLVRDGWWERSLVVVLSDHGESLGDHGEASHGYFIYQSTLAVPLLVHWPAGSGRREARVNQPGGLIDVAPTVLDALHIAAPGSFAGKSLLAAEEAGARPVYGESLHTHDSFGWAPLRSVRVGGWKYIEAPRAELYDLRADPGELSNVLGRNPARARAMREQLHALLAQHAPKGKAEASEVSARTRALLGSLGYLAPGPGAAQGSGADPKDRMAEFQLYESAQVALYRGRVEEAIGMLEKLLAGDPRNTLARRDLGGCYIEKKAWAKARDCFEQVLAAAPGDYMSEFELGLAYQGLGQAREAREHIGAACAAAPEAAQCRGKMAELGGK